MCYWLAKHVAHERDCLDGIRGSGFGKLMGATGAGR